MVPTQSAPITRLTLLAAALALASAASMAAAGDPPAHPATHPATRPAVTGSVIDPGLGRLHHAVSTRSAGAQRFFDQGLTLIYAFNHEAAVQSFRRALQLDPDLAMAYWGIAYALGPDINLPMPPERKAQSFEAIQKAIALEPKAAPRERDYIEALRKRYSRDESEDRAALDLAYKDAMASLSARYADDVDAQVLYAESLMMLHAWKWWRADGTAEEGTREAVAALERALRSQPDHIGANHYYVHAVEMSPDPSAALASAHRLETLAPSAGHLVHMPAHIYMRTGEYLDAARVNVAAAHADDHFTASGDRSEYRPYYHGHNLHFLAVSYAYAGACDKAMDAATRLVALVAPDFKGQPDIIDYYGTTPAQVAVMFDRWADIVRMQEPPAGWALSRAYFHFARALAYGATGNSTRAQAERAVLVEAAQALGPKSDYGLNPAADMMAVALPYLDGRLALMAGDAAGAAGKLRQAAAAEDRLAYNEPPDWYLASNWVLGTALLKLGDAAGAEAAFRADLRHNVEHGRSLAGLAVALRRQGKTEQAAAVQERFDRAWRGADHRTIDF
jgi:tetratricopeptide (TPR) repeat protein